MKNIRQALIKAGFNVTRYYPATKWNSKCRSVTVNVGEVPVILYQYRDGDIYLWTLNKHPNTAPKKVADALRTLWGVNYVAHDTKNYRFSFN